MPKISRFGRLISHLPPRDERKHLTGKNQCSVELEGALDKISRHWPAMAPPNPEQLHIILLTVKHVHGLVRPPAPVRSTYLLGLPSPPSDSSLRSDTVIALYERLKAYHFILVRGTPASGKTVLSQILAQYIGRQDPEAHIIGVFSWPQEEVTAIGGWRTYLHNKGYVEGRKTIFIFDEAQSSYKDSGLWLEFFKSIGDYSHLFAITFASYGSPSRRLFIRGHATPPFVVRDVQRVTLRRIKHDDDFGAVGLLFSRTEFDDLIRQKNFSSDYYFDTSFFDAVFHITEGHVGAILDFVEIIRTHDSYRGLKGTGQLSPHDLVAQLDTSSTLFIRGLPPNDKFQEPPIACTLSNMLRNGSILKSNPTNDIHGVEECFSNGWLHADRVTGTNNVEDTIYVFSSPLHRWFVEWKLWAYVPARPLNIKSILELVLEVIRGFDPAILSGKRVIDAGYTQRPPEGQYQQEFYRSCHTCRNVSLLTFPEYGTAKGRVDFYIPDKKWGVELLRDGDRLKEHSVRFSPSGWYGSTMELSDYILLDCRTTRPTHPHSGITKLFHVVFDNNYEDVTILNHSLRPLDGGEVRLLCALVQIHQFVHQGLYSIQLFSRYSQRSEVRTTPKVVPEAHPCDFPVFPALSPLGNIRDATWSSCSLSL
ncbi:hypothetical protein BJV74DRAFT_958410 [Russula compacta]|nr:hypothetical protein BJV74DRAFT_958410 [Russula compacta]